MGRFAQSLRRGGNLSSALQVMSPPGDGDWHTILVVAYAAVSWDGAYNSRWPLFCIRARLTAGPGAWVFVPNTPANATPYAQNISGLVIPSGQTADVETAYCDSSGTPITGWSPIQTITRP